MLIFGVDEIIHGSFKKRVPVSNRILLAIAELRALNFQSKTSGGLSSLCRSPGPEVPNVWLDPFAPREDLCSCDSPLICGLPHQRFDAQTDHISALSILNVAFSLYLQL